MITIYILPGCVLLAGLDVLGGVVCPLPQPASSDPIMAMDKTADNSLRCFIKASISFLRSQNACCWKRPGVQRIILIYEYKISIHFCFKVYSFVRSSQRKPESGLYFSDRAPVHLVRCLKQELCQIFLNRAVF